MRIYFLLIGLCFWQSNSSGQCQPVLLEITSQAQIDNFANEYPGCTKMDASLRIDGKDIVSLAGLSQIEMLTGDLQISNTSITSFHGLHHIDTIMGDMYILEDSMITDFSGMESLRYIHGLLNVYGNSALLNFAGLDSLDRMRVLLVQKNASLKDFQGLNKLGYIGESFYVVQNPSLMNFQGLDKLDTVNNYLLVEENSIVDVAGLDSLKHVGNILFFLKNPNLISLESLSGLTYTKYLRIGHNASLTSLNGLGSFAKIENEIVVFNNPVLSSLTGLRVSDISTLYDLTLTDNPVLSQCSLSWVCDYLEERNGDIHGNAPGCQSGLEIRQLCLVDTENPNAGIGVTVYPNPAHDYIYSPSPQFELEAYVTDLTGVVVLQETSFFGQLDIAHLPPAVYVLHLKNSNAYQTSKFVKY